MSRYEAMFKKLAQKNEGAFIPFVVLFDPDKEMSFRIVKQLIDARADALELGIAFSDPLADGPTIQKGDLRALRSGSTVREALDLVKSIRTLNEEIPIGILTYANLVFRNTLDWFYRHCNQSGVDSVLVADVPLIEAEPFCQAAVANNVDPVMIAPLNLPLDRCNQIARLSRGYTYVVTRTGVTGARDKLNLTHHKLLSALEAAGAPPAIFGFGISSPAHVREAVLEGASGAISGSRIVSIIEEHLDAPDLMLKEIAHFVAAMKDATK